MNQHVGSCRILYMSLQQLLPTKLLSFAEQHGGSAEECFNFLVEQFAEQALYENGLSALEYANISKQIAEFFEPNPSDKQINPFTHKLRNTLQHNFTKIRKNKFVYKFHDEHIRLQKELDAEKKSVAQKALKLEHEMRVTSRAQANGVVKLIAELFNVGIINFRVLQLCTKHILYDTENPTELDIECFFILYTTAGAKLESDPRGFKIASDAFARLEEIVEVHAHQFCEKIHLLIIEIFEQRFKFSESRENQSKPTESNNTNAFLSEINCMISQLNYGNVLETMDQLSEKEFTKELLEGTVLIIFERSLASTEIPSCFAFLCKGLSEIKAEPKSELQTSTFKEVLHSLCSREILTQRDNSALFRAFIENINNIQTQNVDNVQLKATIDKTVKLHCRACRFASFYAELFNFGLIESRHIFDFCTVMSSPNIISNTSIEFFCLLIKCAGTKIISEVNTDLLTKEIVKLQDVSGTINLSPRSKFLIQDLMVACRLKLKLDVPDDVNYQKLIPSQPMFPKERLWQPLNTVQKRQSNGSEGNHLPPPRGFQPLNSNPRV